MMHSRAMFGMDMVKYRESIVAATKVLLKDPCPSGLPEILTIAHMLRPVHSVWHPETLRDPSCADRWEPATTNGEMRAFDPGHKSQPGPHKYVNEWRFRLHLEVLGHCFTCFWGV